MRVGVISRLPKAIAPLRLTHAWYDVPSPFDLKAMPRMVPHLRELKITNVRMAELEEFMPLLTRVVLSCHDLESFHFICQAQVEVRGGCVCTFLKLRFFRRFLTFRTLGLAQFQLVVFSASCRVVCSRVFSIFPFYMFGRSEDHDFILPNVTSPFFRLGTYPEAVSTYLAPCARSSIDLLELRYMSIRNGLFFPVPPSSLCSSPPTSSTPSSRDRACTASPSTTSPCRTRTCVVSRRSACASTRYRCAPTRHSPCRVCVSSRGCSSTCGSSPCARATKSTPPPSST